MPNRKPAFTPSPFAKPAIHPSYRLSATADEVPPIFGDVYTTMAFAAISKLGPLNVKHLKALLGQQKVGVYVSGLRRLEQIGIVYAFEVPLLKGTPRVYALNRGHKSFLMLRSLGRALWNSSVHKRVRSEITTKFVVPPKYQRTAVGGDLAWRGTIIGRTLHTLAEFDHEIEMKALIEFLDPGSPQSVSQRMDRLVAFGLVRERYDSLHRWLALDQKHPLHAPLRAWLRIVNRANFPAYVKFAQDYVRRKEQRHYNRTRRILATRRCNLQTKGR